MSRSDSRPGPFLRLFIPPGRWSPDLIGAPPRRVSQVPQPIFLRAPSPSTPRSPAVACAHCFTASVRFLLRPKIDHFPFALTRPKQVHLRYGSRIRRSRLRPAELLPLTLDWLPVERATTGQAPFSLQDQPGFSWHTDVCATRRTLATHILGGRALESFTDACQTKLSADATPLSRTSCCAWLNLKEKRGDGDDKSS
jgi:hypothetical protein